MADTTAAAKAAKGKTTSRSEIQLPSLDDLLNAGAHFGHNKSRWEPKMDQYIYTERNGVHIIDLVKTMKLLKKAVAAMQESAESKTVVVVGTKGQAATMVQKMAEEVGAFYINRRWPGGLFTNFNAIKRSVIRLIKLEETLANGGEGYVKKEILMMKREVERLNRLYEGIKFMDKLPGLIVVIDSKVEKNAIREAQQSKIPIVALLDTNCNPDGIEFPIPANDDSIKSIQLFVDLFGEALKGAKRADAVKALRKNHSASVATMKKQYQEDQDRTKRMQEEEADRLKMMRSGQISAGSAQEKKPAVRLVKKAATEVVKAPAKVAAKVKKVASSTGIADLKLGKRIESALEGAGVKGVDALKKMSDSDLTALKGVGVAAVEKIKKALK